LTTEAEAVSLYKLRLNMKQLKIFLMLLSFERD